MTSFLTAEDLKYPVITISRPGFLAVQTSADSLTTGYMRQVRKHWFEGMHVIDSDLVRYEVAKATTGPGVGPFWGFSITYSRRVRVNLEFRRTRSISLEALRTLVCRAMDRDPHLWESDLWEDGVAGWKAKVNRCQDIHALLELLSPGTVGKAR